MCALPDSAGELLGLFDSCLCGTAPARRISTRCTAGSWGVLAPTGPEASVLSHSPLWTSSTSSFPRPMLHASPRRGSGAVLGTMFPGKRKPGFGAFLVLFGFNPPLFNQQGQAFSRELQGLRSPKSHRESQQLPVARRQRCPRTWISQIESVESCQGCCAPAQRVTGQTPADLLPEQ